MSENPKYYTIAALTGLLGGMAFSHSCHKDCMLIREKQEMYEKKPRFQIAYPLKAEINKMLSCYFDMFEQQHYHPSYRKEAKRKFMDWAFNENSLDNLIDETLKKFPVWYHVP